ncbi:hypothetical protein CN206_06975 [Sinorhizobium meliloti]|uniref:hypothetical protein n=1 Tax=Rhizobium meliloti TaxID=382 RepID=UPI000FD5BB4B|nr:hypothetical protein [Sinorhizobium meliloti]RVI13866.1 hypothetical protein CN206_06975 [Sinorhizobium meliloti]
MDRLRSPSQLMRIRRPERYSDSERVDAYRLSESELRNHLDTLTDRNQHKDFENFCRKLCEREVAPNLRPQTGPEGGGDGKVDTETYPVVHDIAERWYAAPGDSAGEYWGFAFSTKKSWSSKVRSDVAGIIGEKRGYQRIICVTSRPARQATRLKVQQELLKKSGVKVDILDREWIIDRVFSHGHKDIAFEHLHAGEFDPTQIKVGPNDFRRHQALDQLEDRLAKPGPKAGDLIQLLSDSLQAAFLSRQLERPRIETDGRFKRAIRLARKYGTDKHVLRAMYEEAWTAFWWFDDIASVDELYKSIEELATPTRDAAEIGKVHNLLQLLIARAANGFETAEELSISSRLDRLRETLRALLDDNLRPSNSLHAETLLALMELNENRLRGTLEKFDDTWSKLVDITKQAARLADFPTDMIDSVVAALSEGVPDSSVFDALVEQIAELMAERSKELSAGEFCLTHGERKLERDRPIDAIRLLGRAVMYFAKKESEEKHAHALYCLSVAYHNAGLEWAAYSNGLASLAKSAALSRQGNDVRGEIQEVLRLLLSIGLSVGAFTDCIATQQIHTVIASTFGQDGANAFAESTIETDRLLACWLAVLPRDQVTRLERVPDILAMMGFDGARTTLLYRLGYLDLLQSSECFLKDVAEEEARDIIASLASQPAARLFRTKLVMLDGAFTGISSTVMGVAADIEAGNSREGFIQAQTYAASIESLTATLLNSGIHPVTDRVKLVIERGETQAATVETDPRGVVIATVPLSWTFSDTALIPSLNVHLLEAAFHVLMQIADPEDAFPTLEELIDSENILDRASAFIHTGIFREWTFGFAVGQVSDWDDVITQAYPIKTEAPADFAITTKGDGRSPADAAVDADFRDLQRHDAFTVDPFIKKLLWKRAFWEGVVFGHDPDRDIPCLGLFFRDGQAGRRIFEEWLATLGNEDVDDKIRVALIKGIDVRSANSYRMHIRQNEIESYRVPASQKSVMSMNTTMDPPNTVGRDSFIEKFGSSGAYLLTPVSRDGSGELQIYGELAILKKTFYLRDAWEIGPGDVDALAFRPDDVVAVPEGRSNPPIHALLKLYNVRSDL